MKKTTSDKNLIENRTITQQRTIFNALSCTFVIKNVNASAKNLLIEGKENHRSNFRNIESLWKIYCTACKELVKELCTIESEMLKIYCKQEIVLPWAVAHDEDHNDPAKDPQRLLFWSLLFSFKYLLNKLFSKN
jgi:hypothetical protein